jgi:hypothetical protein
LPSNPMSSLALTLSPALTLTLPGLRCAYTACSRRPSRSRRGFRQVLRTAGPSAWCPATDQAPLASVTTPSPAARIFAPYPTQLPGFVLSPETMRPSGPILIQSMAHRSAPWSLSARNTRQTPANRSLRRRQQYRGLFWGNAHRPGTIVEDPWAGGRTGSCRRPQIGG